MDRILDDIYIQLKDGRRFYQNAWILNNSRATETRTSNETSPINEKHILHVQHAFLYNLYEHNVKFPFATLFGGRKHRGKFNFFSESELGCGPQDSVGTFPYICQFKRAEIKAKK